MNGSRALIGDDVSYCWSSFAPLIAELARHNLPSLDLVWKDRPEWRNFRMDLLPRLIGIPYEDGPRPRTQSGRGRLKPPTLDADLMEDVLKCLNLMRAKVWALLSRHSIVDAESHLVPSITAWLRHLTLAFSGNEEILSMDFGLDLPDVNGYVHHNNRYGLVHASTRGGTGSQIPTAARATRLAGVIDDKFAPLRDWVAALPNGVDSLERQLTTLRISLVDLRLARGKGHALPEFVNIRLCDYDGSYRAPITTKSMRIAAQNASSGAAAPNASRKAIAALHRQRYALFAQSASILGKDPLTASLVQQQFAFESLPVMANRWRWLVSAPNAMMELRSVVSPLPSCILGRDVAEYVSLRVDNAIYGAGWTPPTQHDNLVDEELEFEDRRRDALWWAWFVIGGAQLWTRTAGSVQDPYTIAIQSAISRAHQDTAWANPRYGMAIDAALRAGGQCPETLLDNPRPDSSFFALLKPFIIAAPVALAA